MCDFDIPPLDYVLPELVDEEFFPHLAAMYNPGILNRQLVTAAAMIHVPCQPIESALLLAGIRRVSAASQIQAAYVPHNRNFHVFSSGDFMYNGIPIIRVDVPPLGAETLSMHYLNSTSVWTDHGCIVNATSKVAMSVVGVRQKLDGVEVVQFAVLLATGEVIHVRYDTDNVYVVEAPGPAVYERVGDDLFIIRGEGKNICKPHPFTVPVRAAIDKFNCEDGVIINANGFDYRVKTEPTVTLYTAFGRTSDNNDHVYSVVGDSPPDGFGDFVPIDEKRVEFSRVRDDRTRADNHASLLRELKSPTLNQFISKLPKGEPVEIDDCDLHVPYYEDIQEYRSASLLSAKLGPMSWNGSEPPALVTSSDVSRRVALVHGYVNRTLIDEYCYNNNVYCNGAMVYATRRDVPAVRFKQCGLSLSTVPFRVNNLILTMCFDEMPNKLRTLRGAAYCVPNHPPLVTLYVGSETCDVIPKLVGGDGLTMKVCALLRQGPADSRTIAGILGLRPGEINKYLYSRMDIFDRVGQPARWFLKNSVFIDNVELNLSKLLLSSPMTIEEICRHTGYDVNETGYVLRSNPIRFVAKGVPIRWYNVSGFTPTPLNLT